VTKKEIVKTISDKTGLTQLQIKEIVQLTFDGIVETLLDEGRVELRNFGVFQVKSRKARKARNPRTGRQVQVPQKFVVTFKPGKEMEARVQELEDAANRQTELRVGDDSHATEKHELQRFENESVKDTQSHLSDNPDVR
jgi:nucleoid DNA-binding protein